MSPSENQLRAALRDGEGGSPDPDQIIQAALEVRRERRQMHRRLVGAVAGVVIVGGIGIGLAATSHDNDSNRSAASGAYDKSGAAAAPLPAAHGEASGADTRNTVNAGGVGGGAGSGGLVPGFSLSGRYDFGTSQTASGCPTKPVEYFVPGGGGTGQFNENAPLFAKPVKTLTLCSYSPETGAFSSAIGLSDDRAQQFVASLTSSTASATSLDCLSPIKMEILATDTSGAQLKPLSVVGTCRQVAITNGTALRYAPITDLTAVGVPATVVPSPTGIESGSPPR